MRAVILFTAVLCIAGCTSTQTYIPAPNQKVLEFTLGAEDSISIQTFAGAAKAPEIVAEVQVRPDGRVSMPHIGDVYVEGLTLVETARLFAKKYEEYGLIRPSTTVTLRSLRSKRVFLSGEVNAPKAFAMLHPLTLARTLDEAGGINWTTSQPSDIRIVRGSLETPTVLHVNLHRVLDGSQPDVPLEAGDIVYVPAHPITEFNRTMTAILGPITGAAGAGASAKTIAQ